MTQLQVRRDTAANWLSANTVGAAGEIGFDTTNKIFKIFDGVTGWNSLPYSSALPLYTPPPTSGWSTTTLGSASVAADKGGRLWTVPSVAGANLRVEYRTLSPTSNYTATICLEACVNHAPTIASGIFLRNSSSGSMVYFGCGYGSSVGHRLETWKITSATAYSTQYGSAKYVSDGGLQAMPTWLRYRDDGTNRYAEYSYNGLDWLTFHVIGRTDFITADQVGWGMDNEASGATCYARLRSWTVA